MPEFRNLGSLITYRDGDGKEHGLGNLFHYPGKGTYEPTLGLVDVSKEHADAHNAALDQALVDGLLGNCQVGQGAMFYAHVDGQVDGIPVTTWGGLPVARARKVTRETSRTRRELLIFDIGDKKFIGRVRREMDCVFFKRVR